MKTVVVIGSREDPQVKVTGEFSDWVFHWEDFNSTWTAGVEDGNVRFAVFEQAEGRQKVSLYLDGRDTHLSIRYGGCPDDARDIYLTLVSFHPEMVGVARPGHAPISKATELVHFGSEAPRTIITNQMVPGNQERICRDLKKPIEHIVIKNISILRSQSATLKSILDVQGQSDRLTLPTLMQERLVGEEYKYHVYKTPAGVFELNAAIVKRKSPMDYRYSLEGFLCEEAPRRPPEICAAVDKVIKRREVSLLDMDYFVLEDGSVKILEWNDSPESVSFECRMALRQKWFFSRVLLAPLQMVTMGPENDRVVSLTAENYFETHAGGKELLPLSFESFLNHWNFSLIDGALVLKVAGKWILPQGIYIRPVDIPPDQAHLYDSLFRAVEIWEGETFGSMTYGFWNMSKMFQTTKSLHEARKKSNQSERVGFPRSYFVKGSPDRVQALLADGQGMIVKSCSGQRSVVVDQNTFKNWDLSNMASIPTLFQETIYGPDLRVHSLHTKKCSGTFAMRVKAKDSIDYRYAQDRSEFEPVEIPDELQDFIYEIHQIEGNPLIGVDFIESSSRYYCLEANPTPGWNWYYNKQTCHTNFLALGVLETMGMDGAFGDKKETFFGQRAKSPKNTAMFLNRG